jgi:hypothetical protein
VQQPIFDAESLLVLFASKCVADNLQELSMSVGCIELRGCLHLEAKGWSPKKWSVVIDGNKRYPVFELHQGISRLGPLFFFYA